MLPGFFSLPPSLVNMIAFSALGMTSVELSMSDGRVGIEQRRLPRRGEAEGETDGVTLFTGVKELGVGDVEEVVDKLLLAVLLLERKLIFLLGVEGALMMTEDSATASVLSPPIASPLGPRRRSRVPLLLPGEEADPPDSMDEVIDAGNEEEEDEVSAGPLVAADTLAPPLPPPYPTYSFHPCHQDDDTKYHKSPAVSPFRSSRSNQPLTIFPSSTFVEGRKPNTM